MCDFIDYFFVTIVLILIFSITSVYEVYSRLFLKIIVQNIIKEVLIRVLIAVAVTLYFLHFISFHQMVIGLILVFGMALVALMSYVYYLGELKFSLRFEQIDRSFLKRLSLYGLFVILGASSNGIVLNIDQLMITSYINLSANGIYAIVFYFAVMIELPKRAIAQITSPLIADSLENQNIDHVRKIYQQTSINQMVVGFLFFIGLVCNLDNLFSLMANGDEYATGRYVVYFIGFAKLTDMAFSNGSSIISLSKYYKFKQLVEDLTKAIPRPCFSLFLAY